MFVEEMFIERSFTKLESDDEEFTCQHQDCHMSLLFRTVTEDAIFDEWMDFFFAGPKILDRRRGRAIFGGKRRERIFLHDMSNHRLLCMSPPKITLLVHIWSNTVSFGWIIK